MSPFFVGGLARRSATLPMHSAHNNWCLTVQERPSAELFGIVGAAAYPRPTRCLSFFDVSLRSKDFYLLQSEPGVGRDAVI
jgi:hypothetical protein